MTKILDSKDMVSEQELVNVEKQLNIKLPDSYRDFLKKYNGGYPQPDGFDFASGDDGSSVDKFLEISDSKNASLMTFFNKYKNRIPKNYVPIAIDPGGNLILIGVNGEKAEVYFWDHENEVDDGDVPGMENMHLIALSFYDFINNLYEIEV